MWDPLINTLGGIRRASAAVKIHRRIWFKLGVKCPSIRRADGLDQIWRRASEEEVCGGHSSAIAHSVGHPISRLAWWLPFLAEQGEVAGLSHSDGKTQSPARANGPTRGEPAFQIQ
jgi:hypothetical protein